MLSSKLAAHQESKIDTMIKKYKNIEAYRKLRRVYHEFRAYHVDQVPSMVTLHNYLSNPVCQDFWLRDFIIKRGFLQNSNKTISVFSVFGSKLMIRLNRDDVKIFVARENVHREQWKEYNDNCLGIPSIDLSLGYDYKTSNRYMRFPLWIMWLFPPDADYNYIKSWCEKINDSINKSYGNRKFCSFLCSHDDDGRKEVYNQLSTIGKVDCDGKLFHNNDELKQKYNDDKLTYLQNYRFNLCPENSSAPGYVTEKIFEAIAAGCVPIYCGNEGLPPEPEILNPETVLFVKMPGDNHATLDFIKKLNSDKTTYLEFASLPRLRPDAAEHIWAYFQELENRIRELIN